MAKIEARRLGRAKQRLAAKTETDIARYVEDFFRAIELGIDHKTQATPPKSPTIDPKAAFSAPHRSHKNAHRAFLRPKTGKTSLQGVEVA